MTLVSDSEQEPTRPAEKKVVGSPAGGRATLAWPGRNAVTRRADRTLLLGALLTAVLLPACGTRLPNSSFGAAQQATAGGTGVGPGQASGAGGSGSTGSGPGSGDNGGATATGTGSVGATGAGQTGSNGGGSATGATGSATGTGSQGGSGGASQGTNTASDVGVTASSITIGNVTSVSGAFGPDAFGPTLHGLTAYVDALNDAGGINGRKINLVSCDDGSDGTQFLACVQKLVEQDHVFALVGNNSDASASAAHYEYTHGVPDLGFPLNNGYYKYPNMFDIYGTPGYPRDGKTVGYKGEIETSLGVYKWFKDNLHLTKAAVFYYVIPVSAQAGCFEEGGLKAEGVPTVYEGGGGNGNCSGAGENPAAPAFDEDVINMRSKGVDTVWDAMDVGANQKLCAAMDRQGLKVTAKVSTIEVYSQAVGSTFTSPCRNSIYIAGSSDSFADTANPLVQRFRGEFAKYQPGKSLHQWALEGWTLGYEFQDAIKSMGANVTRKGFMSWLNAFPAPPSGYTAGGLMTPISYVPTFNFGAASPSCNSVAQWQDSAGTYVQRAGVNTCPVVPDVATKPTDDGS
jgi:branched-chain amino acid transport system substrate-binding protein